MAVFTDEVIEATRQLAETRQAVAMLKKQEEALRAQIIQALGDDDKGFTAAGVVVVHLAEQHRRNVSKPKLQALYPEIFDEVVVDQTVVIVKIDLDD